MLAPSILLLLQPWLVAPLSSAPQDSTPKAAEQADTDTDTDTEAKSPFAALQYRSIGPHRGGRSAAVAGVPGNATTYYMGAAGGGVWRTEDAGQTWANLSDGYFGGSIGAIAVSEWDPNVIYVGGGEVSVRGNVSHGSGMWKSTDRGATWHSVGLTDSHHITRIIIHPRNPDLVYAAVLGHLYGSSEERGVYRSADGGQTWQRVLFANADAGAVEMCMDPSNARVLYASTWRVRRTPWSLSSGGEGSSIWKSTDGGDNWTEIIGNEGMPKGTIGISGVSVSAADPNRVYAIIEAEEGGVFRSDDAGETWRRINSERKLRQRAWYYSRIFADPQDADMVYVVNVSFWRSKDGGKTYQSISTPHGDHHDLWLDPTDSRRMVVADDGGAQVSLNRGESFSTYYNQPTAQFYRVTVDDHFPYRIYGAQQDNSTLRVAHRTTGRSIGERDWEPTAGGESGWIAPDPRDNDIVYGGSYSGFLTRLNHRTGETRAVNVWPESPMGHGAEGMNPRFQWNFPIVFSQHEEGVLYAAGNKLFRSTDEGQSWTAISPDLTHNDPETLGPSGGPITKDNTGVEYYATIFSMAESLTEAGVIWVGSDDGRLHITRDAGGSWQEITPPGLPEWTQFNSIEADPFRAGGAYLAATRYKSDDFAPYLLKTEDYGATWTTIVNGIDADAFTRVIRADPERQGLLYAGTETGMWVSLDDGQNWQSFQQNLPVVPITDLVVKNNDLVVATQGRSFWVLDDLTMLHQLDQVPSSTEAWLFKPRPSYRLRGGRRDGSLTQGTNADAGVVLQYMLAEDLGESELKLEILQSDGQVIRTLHAKPDADAKDESASNRRPGEPEPVLEREAGTHRYVWNLRYPGATRFEGMILWAGGTQGPRAVPGTYTARFSLNGTTLNEVEIQLLADPRAESDLAGLQEQFDFLVQIRDKVTQTHDAISRIRAVRKQVKSVYARAKGHQSHEALKAAGDAMLDEMKAIEEALYQTKNRSNQDPLNFPVRLNNKLSALASSVGMGDFRPTQQSRDVYAKLVVAIDEQLALLERIESERIPAFNTLVASQEIPAIAPESD